MSDFYVTLPSHPTSEFPNNTRASFKVRLPHLMDFPPDDHWEVALSSVSLSRPKVDWSVLGLQPRDDVVYTKARIQLSSNSFSWRYARVRLEDLIDMHETVEGVRGVDFVHFVFNKLESDMHASSMDGATRIIALPRFEWKDVGGQKEVHMDTGVGHGKPELGVGYGEFEIDKELCFKMGWARPSGDGSVTLGTNAIPQLREFEEEVSGKETVTYGRSEDPFLPSRDYVLGYDAGDNSVLFSSKVKWRFTNLNEAFSEAFGGAPRMLYVYANVGESTVVGNTKTDLLQKVPYDPHKAVCFYEPQREQFHPVRHRSLEVMEINVAEAHGPLVAFSEKHAQTTVTLHFRRGRYKNTVAH